MVSKLHPELNKVYFINQYTMIHVLEGTGGLEVDFKPFTNWSEKLIFLEKGQYIKFLSEGFTIRKVEFEDEEIFRSKDFRVLFKHLVSLGYINFDQCSDCQRYLGQSIFSNPAEILDISSQQWFWQNPFNAASDEYHVIFDVKEVIDTQFRNHLTSAEIVSLLGESNLNPQEVYSQKVGITIKKMLGRKRLLESQKALAFSDKSIKEIAYDSGYNDPAYFNRTFKAGIGTTPGAFREAEGETTEDTFLSELFFLLSEFHTEQRQLDFYADQLHLSVKSLSRKVRDKLHVSIGQLIRQQVIETAKQQLRQQVPVSEVAQLLHFEEANHFSAFFKHYTGSSPSQFQEKVQ